jgi:hypothetical protein
MTPPGEDRPGEYRPDRVRSRDGRRRPLLASAGTQGECLAVGDGVAAILLDDPPQPGE